MAKPFQFRLRTVPVSGIVTLDGVPANGVIVAFYPVVTPAESYASDITNSAGKFRLDFFFGDEMEEINEDRKGHILL
jgi:hypothetical protein